MQQKKHNFARKVDKNSKQNSKESFEKLLEEADTFINKDAQLKTHTGAKNREEFISLYPPPQKTLDLHGKTKKEAENAVLWFVEKGKYHRLKTLRIITGKGKHSSQNHSVVAETTRDVLQKLKKEGTILSFRPETKKGKSGAFIIFLPL